MNKNTTPLITEMTVIPVAGHDSMLLNLSGAHAPYFTRNVVILKDNKGGLTYMIKIYLLAEAAARSHKEEMDVKHLSMAHKRTILK